MRHDDAGMPSGDTGAPRATERSSAPDPSDTAAPTPFSPATLAAVAVGGALGTAARIGVGAIANALDASARAATAPLSGATVPGASHLDDATLAATLVANLLGTLALGIIAGAHWPARLEWLRAGLGPGFCGAFTTFSLVMLAFAALGFGTPWAWGLLVLGLAGGLLFAAVGTQIGRAWRPQPENDEPDARGATERQAQASDAERDS